MYGFVLVPDCTIKGGGGGLICAHAPILFLLCIVNDFILTPIKMHLFVLKNILGLRIAP